MTVERRAQGRKTPTEFTFIQLEQEFGGRVLNYSKEGLCFETSSPISSNEIVQFWLSVRRHQQIDGVGRVTWLSEKKNLGGIAFVHLSRTSRQRIDEWADGVGEGATEKEEDHPGSDESPEEIVSAIMQQVLNERGKAPGKARPAAAPRLPEAENSEAAKSAKPEAIAPLPSASVQTGTGKAAAEPDSQEPVSPETDHEAAEDVPPATAKENRDSTEVDGAATERAGELESPEGTASAPKEFEATETAPEGDARPANETTGAMAADAQGLQGTTVPEWLSHPPLPTAGPTERAERHSSVAEINEALRQRYVYLRRTQFLRGAAIGVLLSAVMTIAVFKFRQVNQPGAVAGSTRDAAAAASEVSKAEGVSGLDRAASALSAKQKLQSAATSKKQRNLASLDEQAVTRADPTAANELPATSAPSAGVLVAPGSESPDGPTNAVPRPQSFANGGAANGSGLQPLFPVAQANNVGPTADGEDWNGQPMVETTLGSTPWTFRRRNIHGNPPVSGEVHPAELIRSVAPPYPEAARTQQVYGEVVIDAIIDTKGKVRKPEIVSGAMVLRQAALKAVLGWKYKPAMVDGKPTESHATITLKFRAP